VHTNLARLIGGGESKTVEFKRSTSELREAMQTLCAFANGDGGRVVIGVKPDGQAIGQQVSEQTLHEVAAARGKFEPPLFVDVARVEVEPGRSLLVLSVAGATDSVPFTWDGRAWERVDNTTRRMPQERYEQLLLERAHSRRRWENQPAEDLTLADINREEVLRVIDAARSAGPRSSCFKRRCSSASATSPCQAESSPAGSSEPTVRSFLRMRSAKFSSTRSFIVTTPLSVEPCRSPSSMTVSRFGARVASPEELTPRL
jgi:hypothetical protein